MKKRKTREPIEHIFVWSVSIGVLPLFFGGIGLLIGLVVVAAWFFYTIDDDLK